MQLYLKMCIINGSQFIFAAFKTVENLSLASFHNVCIRLNGAAIHLLQSLDFFLALQMDGWLNGFSLVRYGTLRFESSFTVKPNRKRVYVLTFLSILRK